MLSCRVSHTRLVQDHAQFDALLDWESELPQCPQSELFERATEVPIFWMYWCNSCFVACVKCCKVHSTLCYVFMGWAKMKFGGYPHKLVAAWIRILLTFWLCLLSGSQHHDLVFPLLPEIWQKLRARFCVIPCSKFWVHYYALIYTHCWGLMNSVGSHGRLSLLSMIKVKKVRHFVSNSHKVMTTLVGMIPSKCCRDSSAIS